MKTPIDINSEKVSRKQLFRQLIEVQTNLVKYQHQDSYSQNAEFRNAILAIDHLLERIIIDELRGET